MFCRIWFQLLIWCSVICSIMFFPGCQTGMDFSGNQQKTAEIQLMTYNIHAGVGLDGKQDLLRLASVIRSTGADTVALNEVDCKTARSGKKDQLAVIAEALQYQYLFGKAILFGGGEYGNGILSRYPIEQLDLLTLPTLKNDEGRSALVVKICAEKPYYVIVTHLPYQKNQEEQRVKCMEFLYNYIREKELEPVFLAGDLNAVSDSDTLNYLRHKGFLVTNDSVPGELSYPAGSPKVLLDYIAVYPADAVKIQQHFVVDEPLASDHRPVYTKVEF